MGSFVLLVAVAFAADPTLDAYDRVRVDLVEDRLDDARRDAAAITAPELVKPAQALAVAVDTESARIAFGEMSRAIVAHYAAVGAPDGLRVYHCPMTAAWPYWVQPTAGISNPYMGTSMPKCGEGTSFSAAAKRVAK